MSKRKRKSCKNLFKKKSKNMKKIQKRAKRFHCETNFELKNQQEHFQRKMKQHIHTKIIILDKQG